MNDYINRHDPFLKNGSTPRCQESVPDRWTNWPRYHQCTRAAKVGDRCKTHDPAAKKARAAQSKAKWDGAWAIRRKEIHGARFFRVLEQIAAGHNDARGLAQETIDDFNKPG